MRSPRTARSGQGATTGYQKSSDAVKNWTCSTSYQKLERSAA
jgi:hypothetical protein